MAPLDSNVRKLPEPAGPEYRTAPSNIEAEQAILGAILINNEAYYRVSDFLKPEHFADTETRVARACGMCCSSACVAAYQPSVHWISTAEASAISRLFSKMNIHPR